MSVADIFEQHRRTFLSMGQQMADQINRENAADFVRSAENRAVNWSRVQQPALVAPRAVEPKFSFEGNWSIELVETDRPVTTFDPDSILPRYRTDEGAVGGPVGGPVRDEAGAVIPGQFQQSSQDTQSAGTVWQTPDGRRRFVKVATGFAGLRRYWQELP